MSSKDYSDLFILDDSSRIYDWPSLRDQIYDPNSDSGLYCYNPNDGNNTCQTPKTQTEGAISATFSGNSLLESIIQPNQSSLNLSWVTTGDNDSADCMHSEVYVNVKVYYE